MLQSKKFSPEEVEILLSPLHSPRELQPRKPNFRSNFSFEALVLSNFLGQHATVGENPTSLGGVNNPTQPVQPWKHMQLCPQSSTCGCCYTALQQWILW